MCFKELWKYTHDACLWLHKNPFITALVFKHCPFGGWHKVGLATIIKLGRQLARNLGKDEDEVVRHLRQRLGVLIVRDNATMMASRHPTFAPPDVDGDED